MLEQKEKKELRMSNKTTNLIAFTINFSTQHRSTSGPH